MNQKKNLTYFLLVIALAIWGIIGYKIVSGLTAPANDTIATGYKILDGAPAAGTNDSVTLLLNYQDPFLKSRYQRRPATATRIGSVNRSIVRPPVTPPPAPKEVYWPVIEYNGVIENKAKNTKVVMLKVNNQDFLLKEKQTGQNVLVLKINKDSVLVSYNRQNRYIKRKVN